MAMIGRLSNTSYMGFQYSVDNVVDHLTTTGITAIPDDETTPGRVTILNESEERSDWDDDERSGGKILVIQEKLAQNQQDFLDEYLPQWVDQLATRKQRSELEWENSFATKRGKDHTVLHLLKNEEKDDDLPYPKFQKFKQLAAQIIKKHEEHAFPIATDDEESSTSYQPPPDAIMGPTVYPPARQNPQPAYKPDYQFGYRQGKGNTFYGGYDVISRWESITINRLNSQTWSDNKAKLAFVENLLGENDPQNITSQVRQLIIMEDPYRGSTDEQDKAYKDLDRVTCEETKNLWSFLEDFRQLAIKLGKLYFPSTMEKLFAKLPPSLSKKIEESFKARHPGLSAGVLPAIKFTHTFISEMCKDAALAKELRDLSLCSAIPIPSYYKNNRKKYGIKKSRTYKGKPYNSHVKPFKRKYKDDRGRVKKCKCFICRKKGHFAKDCKSKQGNIARSAVYQELDLNDNWDIISADFDDSSVYSISEAEGDVHQNINIMIQDTPFEEAAFMTIEEINESGDEQNIKEDYDSHHAFIKTVNVKRKQQHKPEEEKDFSSNEVRLLKELLKEKTEQVQQMIRDQAKEYYQGKIAMQEKEELWQTERSLEEFPPLGNSQVARPFMEAEAHYSGKTITALKIRKITTQLYNAKVEFEIPSCPMFGTTAIIDTGQQATHKIKQGSFLIEGNKFKIPLIYAFDMRDNNGIKMLIGANFLRSMKGTIRIERDEITIYKKVTRIKTLNQTEIAKIAELEISEEEFLEINKCIYFNQEGSKAFLEQFKLVIDRLKHQGYIEEEPLKHWKKNGELCKLDIINPHITIEDGPLKHVTSAMEDSFKKHVDSLLEIGAIRPSKSRHRTMAMIENSGTTIDHVTRREIKGKERMVFNYKSLNDNTYKDQYSLQGINTIIKRVGGAKVFSKFDLKSGFHQVAMDEESIPWTTKIDKCFKGTESFIAVYIDDILVFLKNEKEHAKHLEKMLKICEDNGLILSPTKMKIAVSTIDFLGAVIGEGTIKLQPHIIKKIVNFNEVELKTKKGLRPLYEKKNAHGDKRLKSSDYELVRKIKEQVQNLPDLKIPPENAYIILETDGCMEGWGGIVKWKKSKEDPRGLEKICAYASGKFSITQSIIDAEINPCINTLEKLKIYYLDKQEVTLRTDWQDIISFYNKTNSNKSSRVRWIKFANAVTGTGVKINIEHIEGKHNTLADSLSRLVNLCFAECTGEIKELAAAALHSVEEVLQSPQCLSKEYEDHLRISHEDFQPLPRIFTKTIFTHEEPRSLYRHYQLKANQTPIRMDKSNAWRSVAQDIKVSTAKEAVKAMRSLQAIIQCKAQICFGMLTKDNHWSDQREDVRVQNKETRRILIEMEALAQRLGRNNI
uniref:RNA-directed DNA polymerase n=1 Tax=Tanacetum cinerariifolium TaxID=118510 RepID=A0A6L2KJK3_TANCI|nr:TPA: orf y [Tanacetum cinerariifolium]